MDDRNDEITSLSIIYGDECTFNQSAFIFAVKLFSENDPKQEKPLNIEFKLPENYPEKEKPIYTISAPWMSREQKSQLCTEIDTICQESLGQAMLYVIIEKIKQFLNELILPLEQNDPEPSPIQEYSEPESDNMTIHHGDPFTDRKSTFQAHLAEVHSIDEIKIVLNKLKSNKKISQATHNILAYRIERPSCINQMLIDQDYDDDGETHAGSRLLQLLENVQAKNVMVVVSRWFGGTLLGSDRFRHIQNVAKELLIKHNKINK